MNSCIGSLILLPFAGVWMLTIKFVDSCIKKSDALRSVSILISLLSGGASLYLGYVIGPVVGWFIMGAGVFVAIVGTWRSLVVSKEQIELEEFAEKLNQAQQKEERKQIKAEARDILQRGIILDYQRLDQLCEALNAMYKYDNEAFDLSWDLQKLKRKLLKK